MLERTCPVCRLASPQTLLAIVAGQQVSRCPECGSVHTGVEPAAMTESDEAIDSYLVQTAGLGTIADTVARGWFEGARTVLDVGCGYGFGADLARVLLDAQAQGVEPSQAGRRGAQELGLRIDAELLTSDSEVGGPFDVVILSEVLEHVEDPAALLAVVRRQVADQGRLTLTTPAAEIVGPHSPPDSVLQALSVGFHAFLASADGLQQLLENAGFAQVWLRRVGGTLQAVASPSPSAAAPPRPASVPATDLERYLSTRAMAAPPGSALAEGLAVRWLRSVVSRGAFDGVTAPREVVAAVYDERHGFDPRIPTAARDVFTRLGPAGTPLSLGGLAFALGMVALLADRDRALAAEHFRLAADVLAEQRSARVLVDADSADILSNSLTHCALALAGLAGTALDVAELLTRVGATNDGHTAQSWRCRVFTEAVAAGHYNDAAHLRPATVDSVWPLLDADDTGLRAVGCTALFSLAMLELHTGDPRSAAAQFRLCAERCQSERFPQLTDLEENARRHIEIAAQRSPATTHPSVAIKGVDGADTVHLETYWCDAYGVFVAGFVSTPDSIVRLGVQTGGSVVWTIPFDRTDVQRIGAADSSRCGFEAYVPGRHAGRFTVHVHTEHGVTTVDGELPTASLPAIKDSTNTRSEILPMLYAAVRHRPPGPILVLGSRVPDGQESIPDLIRRELGTEVLGVDIHPGPGVDVVCDAHRLSALFGEATCAAVVSLSLLEHLAAPWIVAAECARVLAPGGVAVHVVPWTWPTHAAPNDFWRIAPGGWPSCSVVWASRSIRL